MSRTKTWGMFDKLDENARYALKEQPNHQRTEDFKNGTPAKAPPANPDQLTGSGPQFAKDFHAYYKSKRGFHVRSICSNGNWTLTSSLAFMNFPILTFISEIRNPVQMIHGDKAHSLYFSQDAFKQLKCNNNELYLVKDAVHTDLYDNLEKIPFDKIESFFKGKSEINSHLFPLKKVRPETSGSGPHAFICPPFFSDI